MELIFEYTGEIESLKKASKQANAIKSSIIRSLEHSKLTRFRCSNIGPEQLADLIGGSTLKMEVKTYWYWSRNVFGYFDASKPNVIHINTRSLPRPIPSLVSTLWHEYIHALDSSVTVLYLHHDSNYYESWKEECAPFYVDAIAERLAAASDNVPRTDNTKVKSAPLWKRVLFFWRYL